MGCEYESFKWAIENRFELIHDNDWTFTRMDTKLGSPIFYT